MQFAKFENGKLVKCPLTGFSGEGLHLNLPVFYKKNPDKAAADGWKVYTETDKPDGGYTYHYNETDTTITKVYAPYAEPEIDPEPTIEERIDMIEEAVLEMSEIVYGGDDNG